LEVDSVPTVLVAGALANKPHNGGGAWERMSWAVGLRRLGCDVYFVEQIAPDACVRTDGTPAEPENSVNLAWFREVIDWFGFSERSSLVFGEDRCSGLDWDQLLEVTESAELLVNLSGHLTLEPLLRRVGRKAYVDVDPGFTQFWHADPTTQFTVGGYDFYYTIGENIGSPDCPIPLGGIAWKGIRQPVVLDDWPFVPTPNPRRFTTVASWRGGFGPVTAGGRTYGLKVHEFRKVFPLPRQVPRATFEVALDIHPADAKDSAALREGGWQLVDPREVAGTPDTFRSYVQGSGTEFSVAQGIYVETNSGWFSDRSVRYLASGRPALVQDTGFGRHFPVGEGLVTFRAPDEAAAAAKLIVRDYENHSRAARRIAEEYFDSDTVLTRFLREVGAKP
jgi:hypothetical protein